MSKYAPLQAFLQGRKTETVPMTFAEIEEVIGFPLPKSQAYAAWWSNNPTNNVMTNAWLAAGYRTEQVDIEGRKLVFRRAFAGRDGAPPTMEVPRPRKEGRHPIIGFLKGMITLRPGVDVTEPSEPEWGDIAWGTAGEKEPRN